MATVRSTSLVGTSDALASSIAIPVPSGASNGDTVVCWIGRWVSGGAHGTITAPAGFSHVGTATVEAIELAAFWRVVNGDSGDYTFTWPEAEWCNGYAMCVSGAAATPIADVGTATAVDATTYPDAVVNAADLLAWGAYNTSAAASTAPDGYTLAESADYGTLAHATPPSAAPYTASGATFGSIGTLAVLLIGVAAETTTTSLSGTATAVSDAAAALAVRHPLSGAAAAQSASHGAVTATLPLTGTATSTSRTRLASGFDLATVALDATPRVDTCDATATVDTVNATATTRDT